MTSIAKYMEVLFEGSDLSFEQARELCDAFFTGEVPDVQIAAFLAAMRLKRAAVTELAGLAQSMRDHVVPVKPNVDYLVDTCGTGGAKVKTFNISTAAAIVAAGAGVYVAKHGNRGITSKCGSADVLVELGVKIDPGPELVARSIEQAHVGFMFAPMFHPAMKFVQPIRKSLDFRTAFNILGPLVNPAGANAQIIGVAEEQLMQRIIETLKMLGTDRAMVVHSEGLDEISTMGKTKVLELKDGDIKAFEIDPDQFGMELADYELLKGDTAEANARIVKDIIAGKDDGPRKDIVVLNAAAAIIVGNLADDFPAAIQLAQASIAEGKAQQALDKLIEVSNNGN